MLLRLRALSVLALLVSLSAVAEQKPTVLILKSSDLSAYTAVVAGFTAEARVNAQEITLPEGSEAAQNAVKQASAINASMVLAIGPGAANAAKRAFPDVPIVFCMVPYYERYALEGPNVTGIALTNEISTELATLKAVAPKVKRVGILNDPRFSAKLIKDATEAASSAGMSIISLEVDKPGKVDRVLETAARRVDALLMIADKTVGNAAVVKRLISFSSEAGVPMLGLSPSQVKEGALLSLSPSYIGIGQQAGRLTNRILFEKVDPGALAVAPPEILELSVNLSTAKKLGGGSDVAWDLFRYASDKGFPIKVTP
jgi:putative tryptophan/tyrosine transport system substrate-binding protein